MKDAAIPFVRVPDDSALKKSVHNFYLKSGYLGPTTPAYWFVPMNLEDEHVFAGEGDELPFCAMIMAAWSTVKANYRLTGLPCIASFHYRYKFTLTGSKNATGVGAFFLDQHGVRSYVTASTQKYLTQVGIPYLYRDSLAKGEW